MDKFFVVDNVFPLLVLHFDATDEDPFAPL